MRCLSRNYAKGDQPWQPLLTYWKVLVYLNNVLIQKQNKETLDLDYISFDPLWDLTATDPDPHSSHRSFAVCSSSAKSISHSEVTAALLLGDYRGAWQHFSIQVWTKWGCSTRTEGHRRSVMVGITKETQRPGFLYLPFSSLIIIFFSFTVHIFIRRPGS